MTKGKGNGKAPGRGKVLNFDHLVFSVGNAVTASSYFVTRFGFQPLAVREPSDARPILSHAVKLNKIIIVFESPTTPTGEIVKDLTAHGDFVKDVAFEVHDLDGLVKLAKDGGAELVKGVTEEKDEDGVLRYAVLRTYGDNTHTLIDRNKYKGIFLPGYKPVEDDALNKILPPTDLAFIDHVEGNMADGTLESSVSWYEKNLNMHRFWCVDYDHDLVPYSSINSASVINQTETVLLSMNEAAKGLRPTSKATEFVKAMGTSGVEHVALYTDDIVSTMKNLQARGADIVTWPPTYYDLIREKLQGSSLKVAESIDDLQANHILIDFDERGYMLQAFTKHVQTRPTLFIEILQRRNHRGFGAMNYKWVFEAIERLDGVKVEKAAGEEKKKEESVDVNAA
ncbi:glyoxalase/Bleomycin resistance protein/Dioxygenase superfamily domain-containing protein [Phthorimaea operculella]|nr:glyoxalase/Bleomycin resistance protein/Dioxygenase superfamily domain-containing protein [Phthorimaea operculella]